jgi:tRNA A37 threonylcarbamoyladenosine dehydratase
MLKLRKARVTVIGLGGVGSHAAHMLARSGLGKLRLVDFDRVTLSSLNRHALAIRSDVGREKAVVMVERLKDILGKQTCELEAVVALCNASTVKDQIKDSDLVLDCIDDQTTKIELLEACEEMNIPILASLGAGGKVDPTRLRIAPLGDSSYDPLAARLRARIAHEKRKVNLDKVEVVYSSEEPKASLLALSEEQKESPQEFGAMPHFRIRVMPVLGTSPALFGVAMAARAITRVSQSREFTPMPTDQVSRNMVHSAVQRIRNYEIKVFGRGPERFTEEDATYVAIMCRKRCMFTGAKMGSAAKLEMARWDPKIPLDVDNCVLAIKPIVEAIYAHHEKQTGRCPSGEDLGLEQQIVNEVHTYLKSEKTKEYGI